MTLPRIVSREQWQAAREELLVREKAATRARDALNADRRRLPMVEIDKEYVFEGGDGKATLLDLFGGSNSSSTTSCSRPSGTRAAAAARRSSTRSGISRICARGAPSSR